MLNVIAMCGRLTKDVEAVQVGKDGLKAVFTLACSRDYKDREGNTPCDFIDCVVWNSGAEYMDQFANKGDTVSIKGRLQRDTWKDNDEWKSKTYVQVDNVNIIYGKPQEEKEERKEERKESRYNRKR